MIRSKYPVSQDQIIGHVQTERQSGWDFIDPKRQLFLDRLHLYSNIADTDNKIYVRLIRSTIQTLLSLYYTDEITVNFSGRQLGDDEVSDNINNLAKFDQEEMGLDKLNYDTQWNRLFFGIGIRIFDYWDEFKNVPVYRSIDPMSYIPDPLGYIDNHRFHGFELELTDNDLSSDVYFNIDKIMSSEALRAKRKREENQSIRQENGTDVVLKETNPIYGVYNHYTTIKGKKYLVTLANDLSLIIRFQEIEPVFEEEKENPVNIKFPVILNFYSPLKGDPFGESIPDIIEDKQKGEQLFLNLNRIKAEYEAWGDTFLVDTRAIKNLNDLRQQTTGPKYVRADLQSNPNPIRPVDRGNIKSDAQNMPQIIRAQASEDLGMDPRTLGAGGDRNITATENQRIQKNANLRLILGNKVNQWGEKDFWRNWYRAYYEFFDFTSEKNIKLQNSFGNVVLTIKRDDINTGVDIDIKVVNKSDEAEQKQKDEVAMLVMADLIMQDPSSPNISKTFAKRLIAKSKGLDKDKISVLFPASIEEMEAKRDLELLNRNMDVVDIEDVQEDHLTYIVVYQKAMDTDAKFRAIEARKRALIASGQAQKAQTPESVPGAGGITAQAVSQSMAGQQEQGASSLADISTQ